MAKLSLRPVDPNKLSLRPVEPVQPSDPTGGGITSQPVPEEEQFNYDMLLWAQEQEKQGNLQPVKPTFGQRIVSELPQMIGGSVGGATGGYLGARKAAEMPAATPLQKGALILTGATVGAIGGGMGGKGWQQYYQMAGGKPMTLKEIYTDQMIAGIEEGASELIGRGVAGGLAKGANKFVAPAFKKIAEKGATEAAELLAEQGGRLTLAQATKVRMFDIMEAIAEGSLFGGGKLQKMRIETQPNAIKSAVESLSDDFAKAIGKKFSPEEIGEITLDAIMEGESAFKTASRSLYKQVDKVVKKSGMKGDVVNISPLKKFAKNKLASKLSINRSAMGDTLLENIMKLPDNVNFQQATSLRTALLTQARSMSAKNDVALGLTKQLSKMTDKSIDAAAKQMSPEALKMWRYANQFHREGKEIFNSKIIKSLSRTLQDDPQKAVNRIFQKGASKQIRLLKSNVDKETWDVIKHGYIEKVIKSATKDDMFIGTNFMKQLDDLGDDALIATFSPDEINKLRKLGRAIETIQMPTQQYAGTGRMVIALTQGGLISGGLWTRKPKAAIGIAFTPYAFARIATNPIWNDLLTESVKSPAKRMANLTRLARIAKNIDLDRMKKRNQKQINIEQLRGFGGRGY